MVLVLTTASGCGYSQQEIYPDHVQTVAIPLFENRTFYQGVEFDLTEALVKEIELRTPYKVISNENAADTRLAGTVRAIEQAQLRRRRPGGLPQEMEVTVTVDFEWRDLQTQDILAGAPGLAEVGTYLPSDPVSEPFEIAQHDAVEKLAAAIVSRLQSDW